jgi:hypothetical protein
MQRYNPSSDLLILLMVRIFPLTEYFEDEVSNSSAVSLPFGE